MTMSKLAAVALVALFSLSGPQSPQDDVAALKKEVETLKAQQAAMQRDLTAIKNFLQALSDAQRPEAALLDKDVPVAGVPTKGAATARVMMVEVSDYHCPFCRRFRQETQPQIDAQYIATGKIQYAFIDYPIAQLHPDAFRAHEAANCAGEQGKYWEMNAQLFAQPTRDPAELVAQAGKVGADVTRFKACLDGGKFANPVRESVARMAALGIDSTPTFLLGVTPAPGQPMKIVKVVRGAVPFEQFKTVLDSMLQ
jgi:protein-disulfide isomerase